MAKNKEIAGITQDYEIFPGYINAPFFNPDKVLQKQGSREGIKLYDEIARDPHAGSVLQTRILAVAGRQWTIQPAENQKKIGRPSSTPQEQKIAEFVQDALKNSNFEQSKQELLKAMLYGFYVCEVVWKNENDTIVPDKIIGKHPRRFVFDWDRNLRLLTRQHIIYGEPLPDKKFIVLTYEDTDNPYGKGLGQRLWWPLWFKKHGIKFWLVFLEKYGMPTAIGKYPRGSSEDDKKSLDDALDAIQTETGIRIPDDVAIDLLEATRSGNASYETLCNYMDAQISKAVLGQTLTTDVGKVGSYAASKTHNEVRQDLVEADAKILDEVLNNTIIKWIVDYNFPNITAYPKYQTFVKPSPDLSARAKIDDILVKAGVKISQQYFYDTYRIPKPQDGEEVVAPPTKAGGGFSEFAEAISGQQVIDNYAEQAAIKSNSIMQKMIDNILQKIKGAKSYKEVGDIVYKLYPTLNTADFQDLIARAMLAAGIKGYGSAKNESG